MFVLLHQFWSQICPASDSFILYDVGLAADDDSLSAAGEHCFLMPWSPLTRRKFIVDSKIYAKEKIALLGE